MTTTAKDQWQLDRHRGQEMEYIDQLWLLLDASSDARDALKLLRILKSPSYCDAGATAVMLVHAHEGEEAQRSNLYTDARPATRGWQGLRLKNRARAQREELRWRGSRGFRYHARLADMGRALVERG